jgi:Mn-dependent DtxR family transcriptional regulator
MNINFELYRIFYVVANHSNITKASEELNISQPAISKSIKNLEDQLGGNLFIRTKRGVTLTEEGKEFYNYIKQAMEYINNAEKKFTNLINLEKMKLIDAIKTNHFHPINTEREVRRIENILKKGYLFNETKIKSFENTYYEISFGDGHRMICSKVDNFFELLFIDTNHMIYRETSRFLGAKQNYKYPSCFGKINFDENYFEVQIIDLAKMIIEDYEMGKITDSTEMIDNLKYLIGDEFPKLPINYNEEKDNTPVG